MKKCKDNHKNVKIETQLIHTLKLTLNYISYQA